MKFDFFKMEGLGNDFIIIDDRNGKIRSAIPYSKLAQKVCNRYFGIGADGIITILNSDTHDLKFRIFNPDGSEAQMCGNGMRCYAKIVVDSGIIKKESFTVETLAGTIIPEVFKGEGGAIELVKVDMGKPVLETTKIPFLSENSNAGPETIEVDGQKVQITPVSMGNPHAVVFVDDIESAPVTTLGPKIEKHNLFPEKTNVEFIEILEDGNIAMKVWERGAGITLACGTGACASLVAASLNSKTGNSATVHLSGGDLLIEWNKENGNIFKTGPAKLVFEGKYSLN